VTIGGMEVEPKGTKQRTCLLQQKVMTINDESNDARGEDNKKKKKKTKKKKKKKKKQHKEKKHKFSCYIKPT